MEFAGTLYHALFEGVQLFILAAILTIIFSSPQKSRKSILFLSLVFGLLFFQKAGLFFFSLQKLILGSEFNVAFLIFFVLLETLALFCFFYLIFSPFFERRKVFFNSLIYFSLIVVTAFTFLSVLPFFFFGSSPSLYFSFVFQDAIFKLIDMVLLAAIAFIMYRTFRFTFRQTGLKAPFFVAAGALTWILAHGLHLYNLLVAGSLLFEFGLAEAAVKILAFLFLTYYIISTLRKDVFLKAEKNIFKLSKAMAYLVIIMLLLFIATGTAYYPQYSELKKDKAEEIAQQQLMLVEGYVSSARENVFKAHASIRLYKDALQEKDFVQAKKELLSLNDSLALASSYVGLAESGGASLMKTRKIKASISYFSFMHDKMKEFLSVLDEATVLEERLPSSSENRQAILNELKQKLGSLQAIAKSFENYARQVKEVYAEDVRDTALFLDVEKTLRATESMALQLEKAIQEIDLLLEQPDGKAFRLVLDFTAPSVEGLSYRERIEDSFLVKIKNAAASTVLSVLVSDIISNCPPADSVCSINAAYRYVSESIDYIPDPRQFDHFSEVEETILSHAGDCDDKVILLAGLLERVGFKTRVIVVERENQVGHAFLEVLIEDLSQLERFTPPEAPIYQEESAEGVWLALESTIEKQYIGFQTEEIINQCQQGNCWEIEIP